MSHTIESNVTMKSLTEQVEKLLSKTGGDVTKLRRTLVKRFKDGDVKAQAQLTLLDEYEAQEQAKVTAIAEEIERKNLEARAAQRAKYAILYPKVNI